MKYKKPIYVAILFFAISCTAGNSPETKDVSLSSSEEISSNEDISNVISASLTQLDAKYRTDSSFILPTFNGNCPHKPSEIIELFNFWKLEFDLNISFDIIGEPVFGAGSKIQSEGCIDKIIGSNLGQNILLNGSEHIEIIVGRSFNKDKIETNFIDVQANNFLTIETYGPISYALHPQSSQKDLFVSINGEVISFQNKNIIYKEPNITVKDNGGFLSLKYLNSGNYLIGFYTYEQTIYIDLYQYIDDNFLKIKTLKQYSFPEYSKCNDAILLVEVYSHCSEFGETSEYIGHAGGGLQISNFDVYVGLGDTNIASSVYNSVYTVRRNDSPWGSILKFTFDYENLELIPSGNHRDSFLSEVWIKGLRNPYRFSINRDSLWIADLGTYIEDEINLVSLKDMNVDLGWPFYEGDFEHQPFPSSFYLDSQKAPVFSERIGGLIGGHILKINGKNFYTFGTLDGKLFAIEFQQDGISKFEINYGKSDFAEGNFLLSIEKSREGILLLSSSGLILQIQDS